MDEPRRGLGHVRPELPDARRRLVAVAVLDRHQRELDAEQQRVVHDPVLQRAPTVTPQRRAAHATEGCGGGKSRGGADLGEEGRVALEGLEQRAAVGRGQEQRLVQVACRGQWLRAIRVALLFGFREFSLRKQG